MSREIKATPGLMSTCSFEDHEDIGAPEGKFLVGFYLPLDQLEHFRFNKECTITVSEPTT